MGPSATWLIGRSDLSLPVFPSLPRSSRRPSQCHPQRTRATHIEHPPPKNGWAGRSRDRDAGDPDDLGPTVLHEQGRRQELFHPETLGDHHSCPVHRLPTPASNSGFLKRNRHFLETDELPRRSHFRPDAPLPWRRLYRAPSPPCGSRPDAPAATSQSPLPPAGELRAVGAHSARAGNTGRGVAIGLTG